MSLLCATLRRSCALHLNIPWLLLDGLYPSYRKLKEEEKEKVTLRVAETTAILARCTFVFCPATICRHLSLQPSPSQSLPRVLKPSFSFRRTLSRLHTAVLHPFVLHASYHILPTENATRGLQPSLSPTVPLVLGLISLGIKSPRKISNLPEIPLLRFICLSLIHATSGGRLLQLSQNIRLS